MSTFQYVLLSKILLLAWLPLS